MKTKKVVLIYFLLRRDLTEPGFFFDLDGTLGQLDVGEVEELHQKVGQTIAMLTDPEADGDSKSQWEVKAQRNRLSGGCQRRGFEVPCGQEKI